MPTKTQFIEAYRSRIVEVYPWTADVAKLDRFMEAVSTTLRTEQAPWGYEGEATTFAWRAIGGKGKPTRKALRALED